MMTFEQWYHDTSNSPDQYPNYLEALYAVSNQSNRKLALRLWLEAAYKAGHDHAWKSGASEGE